MPPIAFEIIETVVSRLATAKRKTRILPREKKDVNSKSLGSWDDLVNYDFDAIKLDKKLPKWLKATTKFGNGIAKVTWLTDLSIDYDDPFLTICDLWDIMPAPETEDLQEDCPWLIHRIIKSKDQIEREEKARGEGNTIYKHLEARRAEAGGRLEAGTLRCEPKKDGTDSERRRSGKQRDCSQSHQR